MCHIVLRISFQLLFTLVSSSLTIKMVGRGKIHLFKFTQQTCQLIGIFPFKSKLKSKFHSNAKYCSFLFCLTMSFISSAVYLLFEANSIIEYGITSFSCVTIVLSFIAYLIFLLQTKHILSYIENCERFIGKSK